MTSGADRTRSREFRIIAGVTVLAAVGTVTAGVVASRHNQQAYADAAPVSQFVPIEQVRPNVRAPEVQSGGSTGLFTVDCGTNGNRKFSPDNPVAQPGVKNGAQHVHDFVGNLSITADSSNESLAASGTTCRNGDRSSYFWPVVRINKQANVNSSGANAASLKAAGRPSISCPAVANRLPAVPQQAHAEVIRNLALLDRQIAEANRRLTGTRGQGGPDFVNNAVLGPLRGKRVAVLERIAIAIGRGAGRPTGLLSLADCDLSYDGAHAGHGTDASGGAAAEPLAVTPTVNCPTVRDKLPAVPAQAVAEVNRNLDLLDRQIAEANQRIVTTQGQGGPNFVNNAIVGPLRSKRVATLERIATAIGRAAPRPTGLESLAGCALNNANNGNGNNGNNGNGNNGNGNNGNGNNGGANNGGANNGNGNGQGGAGEGGASPAPSELPGVQGPNLELAGNIGRIVRPASVRIEYRGNAVSKVAPMPRFLKAITGDAKPTSRGPANARATWTCSGFTDRLSDKYVICPQGSQVLRVHDFASCWDGRNTDSANHRDHLKSADPNTGACPAGTVAVPQLRITIAYDIPQQVQQRGQYQLDSFPEENHNPFSDHNDFANVNSERTMARIAGCINTGRRCS